MADPKNWDPQHGPGDKYLRYVNLNFPIIASIVEKVTGERFDIWMRREVLEPMKLDACFNWPTCSDAAVARAVELDTPDGKPVKDDLHGKRPACPVFVKDGEPCDLGRWKPARTARYSRRRAGCESPARGLARIGRMLLNGGKLDGVRVLSPQVRRNVADARHGASTAATAHRRRGFYCSSRQRRRSSSRQRPGCADDMGTKARVLVGHAGDAYGMKSGIWIDRARGRGIAYFVTGVPDPAPQGAGQRVHRRRSTCLQADVRPAATLAQQVSVSPLYH